MDWKDFYSFIFERKITDKIKLSANVNKIILSLFLTICFTWFLNELAISFEIINYPLCIFLFTVSRIFLAFALTTVMVSLMCIWFKSVVYDSILHLTNKKTSNISKKIIRFFMMKYNTLFIKPTKRAKFEESSDLQKTLKAATRTIKKETRLQVYPVILVSAAMMFLIFLFTAFQI